MSEFSVANVNTNVRDTAASYLEKHQVPSFEVAFLYGAYLGIYIAAVVAQGGIEDLVVELISKFGTVNSFFAVSSQAVGRAYPVVDKFVQLGVCRS